MRAIRRGTALGVYVATTGVLVATLLAHVVGATAGNGSFQIHFMDVGQGTARSSSTPGGQTFTVRANGQTQTYSVWHPPTLAPGPPSGLASNVVGSTVTLTWTPPATGGAATGYIVEAAASPGGATIATVPTTQASLTVPGVASGTYYVRVRGTNADGTSAPSNEVSVTVGPPACTPPSAPTGLSGTVSGTTVTLSWTAPASACAPTGYIVQAGSAQGLSNLAIVPVAGTSLTATAPPGTYYVRVIAVNAAGVSGPSNEVTITVGVTCIAPGNPSGLVANVSELSVSFMWVAPSTGGAPATYLLEAGSAPTLANLAVVPVAGTTFAATAPAGTYYVRVRAQNACGTSGASNEVVVTLSQVPCAPVWPSGQIIGWTTAGLPSGSIEFNWVAATGIVTSYVVEIGTTSGATNVRVIDTGSAATSYRVFGLVPGDYYVRLRAKNACGTSGPSREAFPRVR